MIALFMLFQCYAINKYVACSDVEEMKGIKVDGRNVHIKTADCDKVTNITYIHNNIVEKCHVEEDPIKFFPKLTQVIGRG